MLIRQSAGPLDPDQIVLLQRMQHSIHACLRCPKPCLSRDTTIPKRNRI
jgi:hypothetical protein